MINDEEYVSQDLLAERYAILRTRAYLLAKQGKLKYRNVPPGPRNPRYWRARDAEALLAPPQSPPSVGEAQPPPPELTQRIRVVRVKIGAGPRCVPTPGPLTIWERLRRFWSRA